MREDTSRILKQGYYASVSYVDALLGSLIDHMKKIGIYENSIIIFWGDHGWKLGDHQKGLRGEKRAERYDSIKDPFKTVNIVSAPQLQEVPGDL